jgi:hypothetical protein
MGFRFLVGEFQLHVLQIPPEQEHGDGRQDHQQDGGDEIACPSIIKRKQQIDNARWKDQYDWNEHNHERRQVVSSPAGQLPDAVTRQSLEHENDKEDQDQGVIQPVIGRQNRPLNFIS